MTRGQAVLLDIIAVVIVLAVPMPEGLKLALLLIIVFCSVVIIRTYLRTKRANNQ